MFFLDISIQAHYVKRWVCNHLFYQSQNLEFILLIITFSLEMLLSRNRPVLCCRRAVIWKKTISTLLQLLFEFLFLSRCVARLNIFQSYHIGRPNIQYGCYGVLLGTIFFFLTLSWSVVFGHIKFCTPHCCECRVWRINLYLAFKMTLVYLQHNFHCLTNKVVDQISLLIICLINMNFMNKWFN